MGRKRNVTDVLEKLSAGKKVLVRVDFNVPMDGEGKITDDSRIRGAMPTIKAIVEKGCNAILASHMGRPKLVQAGADDDATKEQRQKLSLKPVAEHLSKLIEKPVLFADDCQNADATVAELPAGGGGIVLLENLRFYKAEEKCGEDFAKKLASYADAYVNDAFGTAHRAHGSVTGVPAQMADELCGIGLLVQSELSFLDFKIKKEGEKIAAIIGGSKVSTKLPVIKGLLNQVDTLVLGGGLAYTFMKAKGVTIGTSLCEDEMVDTAKGLIEEAKTKGKTMVLPVDAVASKEFPKGPMKLEDTKTFELVEGGGIEDGWMGLDVGAKTIDAIKVGLSDCTKIVMNGPMGVFEVEPFDIGTKGLVQILEDVTKNGAITVVGGGDSVAALEQFGKTSVVTYVSTGGGASLELLAGDDLPGVVAIKEV